MKKKIDVFSPEFFLNVYITFFVGLGVFATNIFFVDKELGSLSLITLIVYGGLISINIGFLFSRTFLEGKVNSKNNVKFITSPTLGVKVSSLLVIIFGLLMLSIFYFKYGSIPMLDENKDKSRVLALAVPMNGYFLYLSFFSLYAFLFYLAYQCSHLKNANISISNKRILILIIIFSILFFAFIGTGSRRYSLWLILYVMISYHYFIKNISVTYFFMGLAVVAFLAMGLEVFRHPSSESDVLDSFLLRMVVYISNLSLVIDSFETHPLLWGQTFFMDLATVLPGKQEDFQTFLKTTSEIKFEGFGMPPTIFGDLYINFGVIGVFFGSLLFGIFIRYFYYKLILKQSVVSYKNIVLYIFILELFSKASTSGVSAQILPALFLLLFYSVFLFTASFFNLTRK